MDESNDYRDRFLIERHAREAVERELASVRQDLDRCRSALQDVISDLDVAQSMLLESGASAARAAYLDGECRKYQVLVSEIGRLALTGSVPVSSTVEIVQMCFNNDIKLGDWFRVSEVRGLPRLRVFADDECHISIGILDGAKKVLWKTDQWQYDEITRSLEHASASTLELPLCVLRPNEEFTLGVVFESIVIAETRPLTSTQVQQGCNLQLFHNQVIIDGASVTLIRPTLLTSSSSDLIMRIVSIAGIESMPNLLELHANVTGTKVSVSVDIPCKLSHHVIMPPLRVGKGPQVEICVTDKMRVLARSTLKLPIAIGRDTLHKETWSREKLVLPSFGRSCDRFVEVEYCLQAGRESGSIASRSG